MATYYVNSGAAGTNSGADWTNAYTALASAFTAATASGDIIKVHYTHSESLSVTTTYTFGNNIQVISVNKDSSDAPTVMTNSISNTADITLAGGTYRAYMYGMIFKCTGTGSRIITVGSSDRNHFELESCKLLNEATGSTSRLRFGTNSNGFQAYVKMKDCTWKFGTTSAKVYISCACEIVGLSIDAAGSAPTTLFFGGDTNDPGGAYCQSFGCDYSLITGTLVGDCTINAITFDFSSSKLGSGVVILASQTSANKSGAIARVYDCSSGDQHYHFGYYDSLGEVTVSTGIYANDGAKYDGTNLFSWKIVTTANASYYTPFVTPWIEDYHSGASAITPYLEILRDGSTTAYQDDEVWGEFGAKTTSGSTKSSFVNDRMALLGTPADQAAGVGTSGWTGENASAWSGKLAPGSTITPAEIGMLIARVCVGEPSITVYVDPQIRT